MQQECRTRLVGDLIARKFPLFTFLDDLEKRGHLTDAEIASTRTEVQDYQALLDTYSPQEIKDLWDDATSNPEYLDRQHEVEASRAFNQPQARANLDHWTRQAQWSLDETNALLLGRDPETVTCEDVRRALPKSEFAESYFALRQTLERSQRVRELLFPASPRDILEWAQRLEIPMPEDMPSLIDRRHKTKDWWRKKLEENAEEIARLKTQMEDTEGQVSALRETHELMKHSAEKNFGNRERETLEKIIAALAMDGYGYDPRQSKSALHKQLADITAALGIPISEDTARDKLKKSVEHISRSAIDEKFAKPNSACR